MTTPAGWYPDSEVPGGLRYWDGSIWTEHRTPPAGPTAAPAPESPYIEQPSFGPPTAPPPGYGPPPAGGGGNKALLAVIGGVAALLLVVALVAVYFLVIKDDGDTTVSAEPSSSQTKASTPRTSRSSETSASESSESPTAAPPSGEVTDGAFSFSVVNVDTYDTIESADVEGLEVAADGVFLIVELDVTNTSPDSASLLLAQQTLNANGESIRPDDEGNFYANGNVIYEVAPGDTVQAAVAFDVPDGTAADSIRVYGDMLSSGTDLPLS